MAKSKVNKKQKSKKKKGEPLKAQGSHCRMKKQKQAKTKHVSLQNHIGDLKNNSTYAKNSQRKQAQKQNENK